MTPLQNLYLTLFNFGPAIILGIYKHWWVGLAALVACFSLSWILTFLVTMNISTNAMTWWAWVKPPIVASIVLGAGWWLI